MSGGAGL